MTTDRIEVDLHPTDSVGFQKECPIHVMLGSVGVSLTVCEALDLCAQVTAAVLEQMGRE